MHSDKKRNLSPISDRDRQVLEHVARYRLTTTRALRRVLPGRLSPNAAGKLANRLCAADLLAKYPLAHPVRYFVLGRRGAKLLGLSANCAAPLGPQSLPLEYAVLLYSVLGKQPRRRLTITELRERWPWLPPELVHASFCLDAQTDVLELLRVDLGGPADHVARRTVRDMSRMRRASEFQSILVQGQFRLVLITATRGKAQALRKALEQHDWPAGLQVHFSVVPQLLSVTTRRRDA